MTAHPKTKIVPVAVPSVSPGPLDRQQRDAEICRLWEAQWTGPKIAAALSIAPHTVANVVHKNGLARRSRSSAEETLKVSVADAPVEAWQQAMLPELRKAAIDIGMTGRNGRAFVVLCLLRLKPYASLKEFEDWAIEVTEFEQTEIAEFLTRARANFIINADGQPDPEAFSDIESGPPGEADVAMMLLVGVLDGTFFRTADGLFGLPEEAKAIEAETVP